jgi:cbb3-type cytochrome oxidase subunit 3
MNTLFTAAFLFGFFIAVASYAYHRGWNRGFDDARDIWRKP